MSTEHQFQVSLPDEFALVLNQWTIGKSIDDRVKVSIAIGLLSSKMITAARASELAGVPYVDFIELLKAKNIPWMEYEQEEYDMDCDTIAKLVERDRANG